jgi:elongation of very long chain fatty acids protein 4
MFTQKYLKGVDVKSLLKESMVLYNVSQVALNAWMVWRFVDAVVNKNHPFIGDIYSTSAGASYAIWVHYCDKYLEFFDTYFMVLRGRMDQVSFLHVYHHFSIAWAWWAAIKLFPGGDSYFGALLNSWIHVLMYAYYALALLKIPCPWKKYLTQAQLLQFTSVVVYSFFSVNMWPKEQREFKHILCIVIQIWEMTSLFVLFSFFYMKSYGKKRKAKISSDEDQCQKVVTETVAGAAQVVESASKNAGKINTSIPTQNVRPL